jgi:hypothetical protein
MPSPQPNAAVLPHRRWLRFSLRTLLVAIALVSTLLAWMSVIVNQARRQKEAVAAVQKLGGKVFYAHQASRNLTSFDTSKELDVPGWLRQLAGDDLFRSVIFVEFSRPVREPGFPEVGPAREITDKDLVHLAAFPKLKGLNVGGGYSGITDAGLAHLPRPDRLVKFHAESTSLTDEYLKRLAGSQRLKSLGLRATLVTDEGLSRLGQLPKLATLRLNQTQIGDDGLAALKPMPSLRELSLDGTRITDAGLAHLARHQSLSWLDLGKTAITDAGLVHLYDLPNLNIVSLRGTQVTDNGIAALAKALPSLHILPASQKKR